jgi:spore germination protein YaaH
MKRQIFLLIFLACAALPLGAQEPKSLFYLTRDPASVRSFLAHASKIDILVPAWYSVNSQGLVSGGPNPEVLLKARQAHVPVMPIVANGDFDQSSFHSLMDNDEAFSHMVGELVRISKSNAYIGFQFDFENVKWTDRDALSKRVSEAAAAFHKEKLQLTIATVPNAPGAPGESGFSAWIYENWRGAYDLKALAQSVDLICLMTYDQHTRWTTPGPVAGWAWTTANLDYALKLAPPQKLSLGIPLYGYHWFAGTPVKAPAQPGFPPTDKPNPSAEYIATSDAMDLTKAYGGHIEWDATDRTSWAYFYRDDMREWLFFTDAHTFSERYQLVKQRGIEGFCSWVLGNEDPAIWDLLPTHG